MRHTITSRFKKKSYKCIDLFCYVINCQLFYEAKHN